MQRGGGWVRAACRGMRGAGVEVALLLCVGDVEGEVLGGYSVQRRALA